MSENKLTELHQYKNKTVLTNFGQLTKINVFFSSDKVWTSYNHLKCSVGNRNIWDGYPRNSACVQIKSAGLSLLSEATYFELLNTDPFPSMEAQEHWDVKHFEVHASHSRARRCHMYSTFCLFQEPSTNLVSGDFVYLLCTFNMYAGYWMQS